MNIISKILSSIREKNVSKDTFLRDVKSYDGYVREAVIKSFVISNYYNDKDVFNALLDASTNWVCQVRIAALTKLLSILEASSDDQLFYMIGLAFIKHQNLYTLYDSYTDIEGYQTYIRQKHDETKENNSNIIVKYLTNLECIDIRKCLQTSSSTRHIEFLIFYVCLRHRVSKISLDKIATEIENNQSSQKAIFDLCEEKNLIPPKELLLLGVKALGSKINTKAKLLIDKLSEDEFSSIYSELYSSDVQNIKQSLVRRAGKNKDKIKITVALIDKSVAVTRTACFYAKNMELDVDSLFSKALRSAIHSNDIAKLKTTINACVNTKDDRVKDLLISLTSENWPSNIRLRALYTLSNMDSSLSFGIFTNWLQDKNPILNNFGLKSFNHDNLLNKDILLLTNLLTSCENATHASIIAKVILNNTPTDWIKVIFLVETFDIFIKKDFKPKNIKLFSCKKRVIDTLNSYFKNKSFLYRPKDDILRKLKSLSVDNEIMEIYMPLIKDL